MLVAVSRTWDKLVFHKRSLEYDNRILIGIMIASNHPNLPLVHAYRHLYRALLHAVQFSSPNRYVARNQLRDAFRRGDPAQFNQQKITRTLEFLQGAARERGLEHRILKNLLHTAYWRAENLKRFVFRSSLC